MKRSNLPSEHRLHAMLSACAIVVTLVGCTSGEPAESDKPDGAKAVVAASTARATVEPFTRVISAIGSVVARPGRYAALSAPAPTRVTRVFVTPGQRVAAGASLVQLEQYQFAAEASATQAALTAAEQNYARAERLAREGIVPRKDMEQAAADLGAARSAAVTARRAQQLSLLRAPLAGVVTRVSAVMGAAADAGQTLVEIADPSAFDVELSLAPTEVADVRPGARVTLSAGEKTRGESLGMGTVSSVSAAVDSASRAVNVRVVLTTPRRSLRLGESVYGVIAIGTRPNAVVVPADAIVPEEDGYRVFVVDKQGTAIARTVTVGGRTEAKVEILSGLTGGETVVTKGAFGMEDSAKVARPVPVTP